MDICCSLKAMGAIVSANTSVSGGRGDGSFCLEHPVDNSRAEAERRKRRIYGGFVINFIMNTPFRILHTYKMAAVRIVSAAIIISWKNRKRIVITLPYS
ncbi:hypothetical protein DXA13_10300 [Clostridium sp. AM58-1XD]|nr:hypothetical protein DXA13_10300 [Clostridium sp. AM58-1XD]